MDESADARQNDARGDSLFQAYRAPIPGLRMTSLERRNLKSRAHHLQPVVTIGDAGLTPSVLREIELNLLSHELIKIRVLADDGRTARRDLMSAICEATNASPVQQIGKMLVIYRPRPAEEVEVKQKRRSKRATR